VSEYSADDIKVLKGLEPVKQRPGMYTNTENPNHIIEEVIDNSADEALGGHATKIHVTKLEDGRIRIEDDGRGIPTDIHSEKKIPAVEVIFTSLHAGGKFEKETGSAYAFAGGLHGVGVTVTNALSDRLDIEIHKNGMVSKMAFKNGEVAEPLSHGKKIPKKQTGTIVTVKPNISYFDSPNVDLKQLEATLKAKAILLAGVEIKLVVENQGEENKVIEWHYPHGIENYMDEIIIDKELLGIPYTGKKYIGPDHDSFAEGEGAEWAIAWVEDGSHKESFVNIIPTPQGGTHDAGFRNGVFDGIKSFAEQHELMPRGLKLSAEDVWSKVCYVLSAKVLDPQFQGQTKEKLNNRTVVKLISGLIRDDFEHWLLENPEVGKRITEQAISQAQLRNKKSKKEIIKKTNGVTFIPGKLTDCNSKFPEEGEIFFVEGDSAGGSAKQGRDKETQAILALRGKPLNTWELDSHDIMTNEEIADISAAIGISPHEIGDTVDFTKLRYHKVCVLSDADKDGHHIQVLLMALFLKHFPQLVIEGYFYIAQPPLYRVDVKYPGKKKKKEEKFYVLDNSELEELKSKLAKENVGESHMKKTRFKGLGEMNPEQLWETTLDPDTRLLLPVLIDEGDMEDSLEVMSKLLAKKRSEDRKKWISTSGDFMNSEVD
jgi:topoisomerase-4 subunit B